MESIVRTARVTGRRGSRAARLCAGLLTAAAALAALPALAQEPPPTVEATTNVTSYPPEFFTEFRPNTAMEMIGRIPGFSFDGGSFARGFSGTAGNVLIDGARPPSRSDSLVSVLTRIPASSVERIDVIQGGAPGIDMQGKPMVANVIRKPGGGLKGAAAVSTGFTKDGPDFTNTQLQLTREKNGRTLEGELSAGRNQGVQEGDRPRVGPGGDLLLAGQLHAAYDNEIYRATGSFESPFAGGKVRLNGLAGTSRNGNGGQEVLLFPGGAELFDNDNRNTNGEVGLRYSRDLARGWGFEAVLFRQMSKNESTNIYDTPGFTSTTVGKSEAGESIASGQVTLPKFRRWSFESGGEVVFNFNESSTAFGFNGSPLALAGDAVRVEELRSDGFFTATWAPSPTLSLVGGLKYEQSTISASGTAGGAEKTLRFVKPQLNVSWTPKPGEQVTLRIERVVDQLSFGAFAASANFSTGVLGIGNPDLEPEKSWVFDARYEYKWGTQGSVSIQVLHREFEDVLNRVVIVVPATATDPVKFFDITRNLGTSERTTLNVNGRFPLDDFGLKGGILSLRVSSRRSHTIDAVTGEGRRVSGESPFDWNLNLSQTIQKPAMSWNLYFNSPSRTRQWGTRGRSINESSYSYGGSIGWKPRPDLNLGAGFNSGSDFSNDFTFFSIPRNIAVIPVFIEQSRNFGRPNVYVNMRLSY